MQRLGDRTRSQQGSVAFSVAVRGVLVVFASLAMWVTAACSGGGDMDDHMSQMMGGGRDSSGDTATQGSALVTIDIEDFAYSPGNLQVPVGASVTWINRDSAPHSATDEDGSWDTGLLQQGERATLVFDSPGTFEYYCTLHPNMKARLVVA